MYFSSYGHKTRIDYGNLKNLLQLVISYCKFKNYIVYTFRPKVLNAVKDICTNGWNSHRKSTSLICQEGKQNNNEIHFVNFYYNSAFIVTLIE